MLAANFSTVRDHLKSYCDKASDCHETVIVTRKDEKNVVIMSLDQYNALLKSARNAEYLDLIDRAIDQINRGKVVTKTMEELEEMANE